MRVLLISPAVPLNMHILSGIEDIAGCRAYMPNLALPTLAALTPPDVEVRLVDEALEPVPFDERWDVVGITGYVSHRVRMFQIADEFRRRGQLVAIGGPYATLSSARVRPHADVLFVGEAEETWPRFLEDVRAGRWAEEYRAAGIVDLERSPLPAIAKLGPPGAYYMGVVQTSRGCPFACEFCDVIVYLGRKQRHKCPGRVVAELEQLHAAGYRRVFLSDDNFTANRKQAHALARAIHEWARTKAQPMFLSTQLSIDVARDPELLAGCAAAGLQHVFIGIETASVDALRDVKKRQNIRADLGADVRSFFRHGINVQAGMITGFDTDDLGSFERQFAFVQTTGIPTVTVGMLNAPEGTPLEGRLKAAGRIDDAHLHDAYLDTNIVPKQMTKLQLVAGTRWLLNRLYAPAAFLERLAVQASHLPETALGAGPIELGEAAQLWRRLARAYALLDPELGAIPRQAVGLFRRKSLPILASNLLYYRHILATLAYWGVWDPTLGRRPAPDWGDAAAAARASA